MVASLIGDLSIIVNIVLVMAAIIVFVAAPPTARIITLKRLGFMKAKTLNLVCYDDGTIQLEAQTVSTEGLLESKNRDGTTRSFYIGKPQDDTADVNANVENSERDKFMLPFFQLDGMMVGMSYVCEAAVTNPTVITALNLANYVDEKNPKQISAKIKLHERAKDILDETTAYIKVLFPVDPKAIQRNFNKYWSEDMMHSTKMRYKNIGAESNKRDGEKMFKMMFIGGIILAVALGVIGVVAGRFI